MKKALVLLLSIILSSCSFNSFFYFTSRHIAEYNADGAEEVVLKNRKNKKLYGIYLKAPSIKPKATILVLHGNGGNISTWIHKIKPIAEQGYNVLLFDYQGFGKSEGKPSHRNLIEDSQLFLDYLLSRKQKNQKLILLGYSLGGNLAAEIARRNQEKIDAIVLEGAFSSHKEIAIRFVPEAIKPLARLLVKSPYSSHISIKELKKMKKLIIHSYEDVVCPIEMGDKIFENAPEPKEYWRIQGEHCRGIFYYPSEYIQKLDSLLLNSPDYSNMQPSDNPKLLGTH